MLPHHTCFCRGVALVCIQLLNSPHQFTTWTDMLRDKMFIIIIIITLGIKDPEEFGKKFIAEWLEWPLLGTVVANEGVVKQHANESLHRDGQTLPDCWVIVFCQTTSEVTSRLIDRTEHFNSDWMKVKVDCQSSIFAYLLDSCLFCYWSCFSGSWGYIWVGQRADDCDVPDKRYCALPRNQSEPIRAISVEPT